jgi:hypothetical protein
VLVVRGEADRVALAPRLDGARVTAVDVTGSAPSALVGTAPTSVEVVVAALGPVHPETDDARGGLATEHAAVVRDLALLAAVLEAAAAAGAVPVRVVLVSSVIALAPGDDRRRYGGWKNLVEAEVAALVAAHPGARLAVVYPGRLLDPGERRRPWHRLHTPYAVVAERIEDALAGRAVSRLVGADARLWLAVRAARFALAAVRPGAAARG